MSTFILIYPQEPDGTGRYSDICRLPPDLHTLILNHENVNVDANLAIY